MELALLALKSSKYGFDIITVSRHIKDFNVDLKALQKQFDKISKQVEKETESQPALALLMNTLLGFFRIIFGLLEEQIKLNQILQEKLGNKTVDSKRANNENINGRGCEKKKGVDSSDKSRIKTKSKEKVATKDVKVVEQ